MCRSDICRGQAGEINFAMENDIRCASMDLDRVYKKVGRDAM